MGTVAAAPGDTIYVNGTSGNDDWDGQSAVFTSGTNGPKLSIKNATKTVNAGGTVKIANGQYTGVNNTQIIINKNMNITRSKSKEYHNKRNRHQLDIPNKHRNNLKHPKLNIN